MKKSDPPIIIETTTTQPIDIVWKAITHKNEMVQWFFDQIPAFEARVGFTTEFTVTSEEREFPHRWKIIEVIEKEKITYDWSYENWAGRGLVTFELFEKSGKTLIRLTNVVSEDFDETVPEFQRESCIAGWEYFIQSRLSDYLKNRYEE